MIRTKLSPFFHWCRRQRCPRVSLPFLEASSRCADTSVTLSQVWLMSPGESLGLELDRRADGDFINVVTTLLGASRLETGFGGSRLPFSGGCS
jgi:hypothetical protein